MTGRPFEPGSYPVVIVGTGPGGMQVSYDLRRLGVPHALLSADDAPGGMFRRFPLLHRLNTCSRPHAIVDRASQEYYRYDWNSLLTDDPDHRCLVPEFMDCTNYFPSRAEMLQGLEGFAQRSGLQARYGCRWESTRRDGDGFVLVTSDGEYRTPVCVFAIGMSDPWKPPIPGIDEVPHYSDLLGRDPESFRGLRVFVVGKRNSAFEVADALLPLASQIVCGSPHHVRPSVVTGVPTPPRARYLEVLEDHCFGGGSFVVDVAIERIERTADGWTVHCQGTTTPGEVAFQVDEVIATTGFGTPLGDLRDLGVATFYKDRLPAQTPYWESTTVPGIYFAGATTQGQVGLRKYGFPTRSASVGGFRYNARVQAEHLARRFGIRIDRPAIPADGVVDYLLREATSGPALWSQQAHLARVVSLDPTEGVLDQGILPLAPFVDAEGGGDGVAIVVETDPEDNIQPAVYLRRNGRVTEHVMAPAPMHDFRTAEHHKQLTSLLTPVLEPIAV